MCRLVVNLCSYFSTGWGILGIICVLVFILGLGNASKDIIKGHLD